MASVSPRISSRTVACFRCLSGIDVLMNKNAWIHALETAGLADNYVENNAGFISLDLCNFGPQRRNLLTSLCHSDAFHWFLSSDWRYNDQFNAQYGEILLGGLYNNFPDLTTCMPKEIFKNHQRMQKKSITCINKSVFSITERLKP